jgi:hypothetical protein
MDLMNKAKFVFLILVFSLIAFITIFVIISSSENDFEEITETDNNNELDLKQCQERIDTLIVGKWQYIGDDLEIELFLTFNSDETFITNGWGGDGRNVTGEWNLEGSALTLDFKDQNAYWENLERSEDFSKISNINYQPETNVVEVKVGYSTRTEDVDVSECKELQYHIDIMNYFLHKSI